MDKRKPQRVYQHEPLITPYRWSGEERQFALRAGQLIDALYNKIGSLESRIKELEGKKDASV
jgi:hypothetical protein